MGLLEVAHDLLNAEADGIAGGQPLRVRELPQVAPRLVLGERRRVDGDADASDLPGW